MKIVKIIIGLLFWPLGVWWLTGLAKARGNTRWTNPMRLLIATIAGFAGLIFVALITPPSTTEQAAARPTEIAIAVATDTAVPAPTAILEPTAAPTDVPPTEVPSTAVPAPAATARPSVSFVSVTGAAPGGRASATVEATPNQSCTLAYNVPSGAPSTAAGLGAATTGANGRATWSWQIGPNTGRGTGSLRATCGGASATAPITIG